VDSFSRCGIVVYSSFSSSNLGFRVSPASAFQLASIGGPPPLPGQDDLRNSVSTQHSADAVMQTVPDPESRAALRSKSRPFLPGTKGIDRRLQNLLTPRLAPMPLKLVSIQ
jgi:hypothetical protein